MNAAERAETAGHIRAFARDVRNTKVPGGCEAQLAAANTLECRADAIEQNADYTFNGLGVELMSFSALGGGQ